MALKINKRIGDITPNFNPRYFKEAYNNYKLGRVAKLVAMIEFAEIDSHVAGCLLGRDAGYKKEWSITPASDNEQDVQIAEFFTEYFKSIGMRDLFEDIMDAKKKKFVVLEFENWDILKVGNQEKQVPTEIRKMHQKYFRLDTKDNNKLKIDDGNNLLDIPETGGFPIVYKRNPIMLPVLRDFILKEFGVESWAAFMETFGEPFIIGKYPPGSDAAFISQLEEAVNSLGASSRGVAPMGSEIEIKESHRSTGDHEKFAGYSDKGIAISLLGHANAVQQSSTMQIGENLAPYKVKLELAVDDIYFIETQIQALLRFLIIRNYAGVTKFPTFSIDKSEPINVKEFLLVLDQAYEQGMEVNPSEYAKLGMQVSDKQKPLSKTDLLD